MKSFTISSKGIKYVIVAESAVEAVSFIPSPDPEDIQLHDSKDVDNTEKGILFEVKPLLNLAGATPVRLFKQISARGRGETLRDEGEDTGQT